MDFRIPDTLKIGGQSYSVNLLLDDKNFKEFGNSSNIDNTINIHTLMYNSDISIQAIKNTFWHEVVHQVLEAMGESELTTDEKFVTTFSSFLNEAINSMQNTKTEEHELPEC